MLTSSKITWLCATTALTFTGLATPVQAQGAAPAASTSATTVTEVTVTARHRRESLQRVPIAISVVDGKQAAAKNLFDLQGIATTVPAVDFRANASNKDQTVFVRGVGTISTSPGVEPSVSTVIDGVVMARSGQATVDLLDLDHIEVLRGPQGTLFGKNASAGVINIITKSPTSKFTGYVDDSIYEGGEYREGAEVSGPLMGDQLKGLISAFNGQYGGNVYNSYLHEKVNGYDDTGARMKLVATPSADLTFTFGADYTHSYEDVPTGVWAATDRVAYPTGIVTHYPAFPTLLASEGIVASNTNTTISSNDKSSATDDNGGFSLQGDWDLDGYRLTSISAYREWRNVQYQDYDELSTATTAYPQIGDIGHLNFDQVSEEFRVASPKNQFIDYVAGVYYLDALDHETYERDELQLAGGPAPGLNDGDAHYGSSDANYAVFGEANVNFTPAFRLVGGVRSVWDSLSYYLDRDSTHPTAITAIQPSFAASGSETKNGFAGRTGLQYDINPLMMAYVTYSHGYKGPAYNVFFNMAAAETAPLNPETSNSYEVGLKGRFFDQRLQADLSAFRTDFSNYQANSTFTVLGAIVTNLVNAGSVRTQGVEGDFTAKPISGLTLDLNLLYDEATVVNFPCPVGSPITCNINGEPLPFAPKWKTHMQGDYRIPVSSQLDMDFETDYDWQAKTQYQLSETPQTIQPAYGIWNGSIALLDDIQGWSVRAVVKNITDQHYSSYLNTGNEGATGIVRWVPRDENRYFGVNLHDDF